MLQIILPHALYLVKYLEFGSILSTLLRYIAQMIIICQTYYCILAIVFKSGSRAVLTHGHLGTPGAPPAIQTRALVTVSQL